MKISKREKNKRLVQILKFQDQFDHPAIHPGIFIQLFYFYTFN